LLQFCSRGTRRFISQAYANASAEGGLLNVRKNMRMHEYNNQVTTALIVQVIAD
jgi:hypothetical protein